MKTEIILLVNKNVRIQNIFCCGLVLWGYKKTFGFASILQNNYNGKWCNDYFIIKENNKIYGLIKDIDDVSINTEI